MVDGPVEFEYSMPKIHNVTDVSGDTFQVLTFTVLQNQKSGRKVIGTSTIWHNRRGAFMHFQDTQSYPLNEQREESLQQRIVT